MGLLDTTLARVRAWTAAASLASDSDRDRQRAMQTLRELGPASQPALRAALRRAGAPRAQFAAAVVLHWLHDPAGMPVLLDALRWQIATTPQMARDLEAAFVAIGPPDAVDALMRVWQQTLPAKPTQKTVSKAVSKESRRILTTICRAWVQMGDPRPLALLVAAAEQIPELFEDTVPRFHAHALPHLVPLTLDALPVRRSLAVRTLRHIPGEPSGALLTPLLRDPDPAIRALAALALDKMWQQRHLPPGLADAAILRAVQAGFSTPQAVDVLIAQRTPHSQEALLQLALRWPQPECNDTLDAVLAALPALNQLPFVTPTARAERMTLLCGLLTRCDEPRLLAGIARTLTQHGSGGRQADAYARKCLLPLLAHLDSETRNEAAYALAALDDPLGKALLHALDAAWPPVHWRDRLQSLLRGGSDALHADNDDAARVANQVANQVANEAVQWFSRLSRGTAERLGAAAPARTAESLAALDARLPHALRLLLSNALAHAARALHGDQTAPVLDLCVACIRALARLEGDTARLAHAEFVRALHLCPSGQAGAFTRSAPSSADVRLRDQAEGVRLAAGHALLALYGPDSFPLFLECLYAAPTSVRAMGIAFLGELADARSLPHLQQAALKSDPLLAVCLTDAIARIRDRNPETMTLLRASAPADARPHTLLRPASGNTEGASADILLRPMDKPLVRDARHNRPQ